jgi:DNA-binding transcriptional ArsR family regulator
MSDDISVVFAALSDSTRRRIFEQLLEFPEGLTATELAEGATISRQAIVKHLQLLANAGLAVHERDGRDVRYRASTDAAQNASSWLSVRASAWDRRIATLRKGFSESQSSHPNGKQAPNGPRQRS